MYLEEGQPLVLNVEPEMPFPVVHGDAEYPDLERLQAELGRHCQGQVVEATDLASEAGTPQAANVVLFGGLFDALDTNLGASNVDGLPQVDSLHDERDISAPSSMP